MAPGVPDIYLDPYEMRCYVSVHRRKLQVAIDLESELSVVVALYSLA